VVVLASEKKFYGAVLKFFFASKNNHFIALTNKPIVDAWGKRHVTSAKKVLDDS